MKYGFALATAALTILSSAAFAQAPVNASPSIVITVDEHGHGIATSSASPGVTFTLPSAYIPDPGPGGNPSALTYSLGFPPAFVPGDVIVVDSPSSGFQFSDLVRFNPSDQNTPATLVFYSFDEGVNSLPTSIYPFFSFAEEDSSGVATYVPQSGDPGYIDGFNLTYHFVSDAVVPEPSTFAVLGFGAFGVALLVIGTRRRKLSV
ncbi:hypothetical protein CCAX7_63540 [Capsulimonas corticalis]|uniref:Uncharacterized protein n=1 Tax=Capsulimonas corticalis TaxID=2219043 RepID=A0A402CWY6_9BACT|nr:PEP-CTERM sorting domain-containing protein [Capsulimonas corticalis]BDI34303.1 hypothetical protein CCAX7_63540 [Capsulimonas corticalis]